MSEAIFGADFLLEGEVARRLYHEYAAPQPILDYHCHLSPGQIAQGHQFRSIAELWLYGDHYKWRAMRANGVAERFCTGGASDWEKFEAWAHTVPKTLRNPLYHWTHLELKKPFGISELLDEGSARTIFRRTGESLKQAEFSAPGLLKQFGVAVVCTTDDPVDALEHHQQFAASDAGKWLTMLPTWRPDAALGLERPEVFNAWISRLESAAACPIQDYDALLDALEARHAHFHDHGCRLADHGLERLPVEQYSLTEVREAFALVRKGGRVSRAAALRYQTAVLHELAMMNHSRGWCQQLHLGAIRNVSSRLTAELGADAGADSIGDAEMARPLGTFLDRLERAGALGKTILYNLNPRDSEVFATMAGNFQDGSVPGKLQYGPAWWFLDQLDGMRKQLDVLSNHGLLARFVGMVTDSRSFLSFSRHEYFRRLLCQLLGAEMEKGLLPMDVEFVGAMVEDLCFYNAKDYFELPLPSALEDQHE